jgi:hypothetical protein
MSMSRGSSFVCLSTGFVHLFVFYVGFSLDFLKLIMRLFLDEKKISWGLLEKKERMRKYPKKECAKNSQSPQNYG